MKEIFARSKHKTVAKGLFQLDENKMVVKWKALLHIIKTPGMSADPFFLFILSNILGRPIVMHGQGLSVPVGKTEMRGIYLPSLMNPAVCHKTSIMGGGVEIWLASARFVLGFAPTVPGTSRVNRK